MRACQHIMKIWFVWLLLLPSQLIAGNILKIADNKVQVEDTVTMVIELDNDQATVAFQADIPLPKAVEFVPGSVKLNPDRITDHTVSASLLPTGVLRIICHSPTNASFKGNKGALVSFRLKAKTVPGDYSLQLTHAVLSDKNAANILTGTQAGTLTILGPNIVSSADSLDFGMVPLQSSKELTLTLTNQGNTVLHVSRLHTSNPWFRVAGDTIIDIGAGASYPVKVQFDSKVRNIYNETLTVYSNDPDQAMLKIKLKAVAFAVNELHAGDIFAYSGKYATMDFSMNNMDPITGLQFDLNLPPSMSFVQDSAFLTSRKKDHTINVKRIDSVTLRVITYSKTNQPFSENDGKILSLGFLIHGKGGSYPIKLSRVILSDTSAKNVVSAYTGSILTIAAADIDAPTSLSFGNFPVSRPAEKSLPISNLGNDTLKITSIRFSDTAFSTKQKFPLNILPGKTYDLPVATYMNTKGKISGTMSILSNDPDEDPFNVQLSGNAYVPNYLSVKDSCYHTSDTIYVDITVENVQNFVALQFDLTFPSEQLKCLSKKVSLTSRAADQQLSSHLMAPDTLRVLAYSMTHSAFKGSSGPVVRVPFVLTTEVKPQSIPLRLSHAILADSSSKDILWETRNGTIRISGLPDKLPLPSGADSIDTYQTAQSVYAIAADSNASWFHWHLLPENAGSLVSNGTKATVTWNADFRNATAYLFVVAGNTCDSVYSDTLAVYVYSTVGIKRNNRSVPRIVVAPNPSGGTFNIKFPPLQNSIICNIIDLTGKVLRQIKIGPLPIAQKTFVNLAGYGKGIYYLQFIYNDRVLVKKILIIK